MPPKKILFWHGYRLSHSGSNVYALAITRELARMGHSMTLMCQEADTGLADDIAKVIVPDIGGLLPVYVLDEYPGYEAKTFLDLNASELNRYVKLNREALRAAILESAPDVVHVNHAVVGPFMAAPVCRELGVPLVVTVQGSDMLFAAGRSGLYRRLARLGLAQADAVVALSRFGVEQIERTLGGPGWLEKKISVISPGIDASIFQLRDKHKAIEYLLSSYGDLVDRHPGGLGDADVRWLRRNFSALDWRSRGSVPARYACRLPDSDAVSVLSEARLEEHQVIAFVGNMMGTKGVQYLIAAAPYVLERHPGAIFVISGFGALRAHMQSLLFAAEMGDARLAAEIAAATETDITEGRGFPGILESFFRSQAVAGSGPGSYFDSTGRPTLSERVVFTGMIEHAQSKYLLAAADVAVVPSVMPESFGIVATEAMASGALTVMSRQSALAELAEWEASVLGLTVDAISPSPDEGLVAGLAGAVSGLLSMREGTRKGMRKRLAGATVADYTWGSVAERLDRLYAGLIAGRMSQAG